MATMIPNELVEEIRLNLSIVDIVSPYVQLHKQGRNLFGKCPFHEERTPSFSVNEEKQIFKCFSCGRGGNVFSFIQEIDNLSFPEAVIKVAPQAGVDLDAAYTQTTNAKPVDQHQLALLNLYQDATKLYHHLLVNTAAGETALSYLHERGLDDTTIDAFMLGYAPDNDALLHYFEEKKIDYQLMRESELFIVWDDGSLHDRFNNRVLFTIRDAKGQPIAYSGRRLNSDESEPKYINSPESPLFNKSQVLFNLDLAKGVIKKTKSVILFEGFMDVIAAFQAGVQNGVASMGTSLTPEQIKILDRQAQRISVTYDSDHAGQAATKRALDLLATHSQLRAQVIHIPDGMDPDEYLRSHDAQSFMDVFTHNVEDPIAFNIRYLQIDHDLTNQAELFNYIEAVLPVIAQVKEPVIRETYLEQLAEHYKLSLTGLQDQIRPLLMRAVADQPRQQQPNNQPVTPYQGEVVPQAIPQALSRGEQAEQILLAWMFKDQDVWLKVTSNPAFHFTNVPYETLMLIASEYRQKHNNGNITDIAAFMDYVQRPELIRILAALEDINENLFADKNQVDEYIRIITQKEPLNLQIQNLKRQIYEAKQLHQESLGLVEQLMKLLQQQQLEK
ncbi:MAG: DNA primase [Lactobacillaceae bacterium]|nr:DNA primase [Lactobacillaceae bacterium]